MKKRIDIFADRLLEAGAHLWRAGGMDELEKTVGEIVRGKGSLFSPMVTPLEKDLFESMEGMVDDVKSADVAVEEVEWGVAETGSIVVTGARGRQTQTSLVPPHHVAILRGENILDTMDDVFELMGENLPSQVVFITGPSRTADIELTLTIGVHGPKRLDVVILEGKREE